MRVKQAAGMAPEWRHSTQLGPSQNRQRDLFKGQAATGAIIADGAAALGFAFCRKIVERLKGLMISGELWRNMANGIARARSSAT
jgi:hypothetical protein